jgi:hypothetical protein
VKSINSVQNRIFLALQTRQWNFAFNGSREFFKSLNQLQKPLCERRHRKDRRLKNNDLRDSTSSWASWYKLPYILYQYFSELTYPRLENTHAIMRLSTPCCEKNWASQPTPEIYIEVVPVPSLDRLCLITGKCVSTNCRGHGIWKENVEIWSRDRKYNIFVAVLTKLSKMEVVPGRN